MRSERAVEFPRLPEHWLKPARRGLPALARDIQAQICAEVPEYASDPVGVVEQNVQVAVRVALSAFIAGLAGEPYSDRDCQVFRRLGRLEAESGRSHETLQLAYRVAAHEVANFLSGLAREVGAAADEYATVRHAVIGFMEHLAGLSRTGFEDALLVEQVEAKTVAHLLDILVRPGGATRSRVVALAAAADWPVPERVRALELVPPALFRPGALRALRDAGGAGLLVGRLRARCVGFLDADLDPAPLEPALPGGAAAVVGPPMPLLEASRSCRIAHRLVRRAGANCDPTGIVGCDDQLLELFGSDATDVMVALAHLRLMPLVRLGIVKRVKAARVLSALLEYGGLPRDAPELVGVSPSTLQYRKSTVEEMFGDALRNRQQRVELLLALRAVLPQWEAELSMHDRHRSAARPRRPRVLDTARPPAGIEHAFDEIPRRVADPSGEAAGTRVDDVS